MSAFTDSVAENLKGLKAVSTGFCSGCSECRKDYGFDLEEDAPEEHYAEPYFSSSACDCCGTTLGGDREPLHWIDENGSIMHGVVCTDCVLYLANGDVPDEWDG